MFFVAFFGAQILYDFVTNRLKQIMADFFCQFGFFVHFPQFHKDVLNDIFGRCRILNHIIGKIAQGVIICLKYLFENAFICKYQNSNIKSCIESGVKLAVFSLSSI
jgi:hypothetical protein